MRSRWLVASLFPLVFSACAATPEQIETWKGTQRGPDKLRAVVEDDGADPKLRALAAAALVEIGMGSDAQGELAKASGASKPTIVHELVTPLAMLLGTSVTTAGPTTEAQRSAKDMLFVEREDAAPADRARIDELLLSWTTVDLSARASLGGQSSAKILTAIGAPAADRLVPLVHLGPDLLGTAKLIGQLGNPGAQQKAVAQLVTAARSAPVGIARVPDDVLSALASIGGDSATAFLLEVATRSEKPTRKAALFALSQGRPEPKRALAGALAIAADAHADPGVREAAFQVLDKLGPPTVEGVMKMFHDADSKVRFRAVHAAFLAGGVTTVDEVLAALPEDRPVPTADVDDFVVRDLVEMGDVVLPALAKATGSKTSLGRVAAIRAFGQVGKARDAATLAPFLADTSTCATIRPPARIADEAKKASTALAARH
ncbi:MAG: hypothetical protein ABI321_17200 [Polyangia bacterium]